MAFELKRTRMREHPCSEFETAEFAEQQPTDASVFWSIGSWLQRFEKKPWQSCLVEQMAAAIV
jgi:hypothetical protein